ncbi:hypothetical protein DFH07DRAFT_699711, partial [Mycena maculata]
EVLYFLILAIDDELRYIAVASFYGPPDPYLHDLSFKTYWSSQHLRNTGIHVVDIKDILAVVMM